jgi:hypothetical protein
MALDPKEVKCRLTPDTHAAFKAICDLEGVGYAEKGEALIEAFVRAEIHRYMLAKQSFESLGFLRNLRDLAGKPE